MRTMLLAGCLLGLAALAPPALAEAPADDAAIAPEPALAIAAEPAPAPAEAAPAAAAVDAAACATEPQALGGGGFNNWCGDPCTPPPWWAESECVGYDCRGILVIGQCSCVNDRWTCGWQEACQSW